MCDKRTYLRNQVPKLTARRWLARTLWDSLADVSLGGQLKNVPSNVSGCWLFRALMAHIKCATGRKQGYGYEQFIGDVRRLAGDSSLCGDLQKSGATQTQIVKAGTTDSLRRKLVDWVSGLREVELAKWQVDLVAAALAHRLGTFKRPVLLKAADAVPDFIRRVTYEDRIAPYRYFEPLRVWIEQALSTAGIQFEHQPRHLSLVSDLSSGKRKIGTTPVIVVGKTLIHWKSAHGKANTGHKTKELCGRAFSLKHRLTDGSGAIKKAEDVDRLVLVLDGTFDAKNVGHLVRAGWDHVITPPQIHELPVLLGGA